jgi:hypothetical protein
MRSIVSILALLLVCAAGVRAQELMKVEVLLDQRQYLPNEPMEAKVRITNQSGQPLVFGKDEDWLTFTIEGAKNQRVAKIGKVPVGGVFTADTQARTTAKFEIGPYFELSELGNYSITASVLIKDWERTVMSEPERFDVVRGTTIWKQEFGIPDPSGNEPPIARKYHLIQSRNSDQLTLYLRITDASESRTYKVLPLGLVLTFGNPDERLDRVNNLHVLHQSGRQTYSYHVIDPVGEIVLRQTYQISSKPRLVAGQHGEVLITGGYRVAATNDFPKLLETTAADPKTSTP